MVKIIIKDLADGVFNLLAIAIQEWLNATGVSSAIVEADDSEKKLEMAYPRLRVINKDGWQMLSLYGFWEIRSAIQKGEVAIAHKVSEWAPKAHLTMNPSCRTRATKADIYLFMRDISEQETSNGLVERLREEVAGFGSRFRLIKFPE